VIFGFTQAEAQRKRVRFGEEDGAGGYAAFAFGRSEMESASSDESLPIKAKRAKSA